LPGFALVDGAKEDHPMRSMSACVEVLFAAAGLALATGAFAQDAYPVRPVRLIVPYPTGGGSDIIGRIIAEKLSEQLGRQVIVDNRGGASTAIGAELAAKAPADGYTLLLATVTTLAVLPNIKSRLPYDYERDFTPISMLATQPYILVVHPSTAVTTVAQLVAHAKAYPGKVDFGSPGTGSSGHIAGELFKSMAGINMTHIAYKGSGPSIADLLGGHVFLVFSTVAPVKPLVNDRRLRALAVTTAKRAAVMPDVPTVAESGVKGYESNSWNSLLAPKGTPAAILKRLNSEVVAALRSPPVEKRLIAQGVDPEPGTPRQLDDYIKSERARMAKLLKAMDLQGP
jgi:tripartite-type tricarboxylate transporter receptor subunit TctC